MSEKIRVGLVGIGRTNFAHAAKAAGMELVAICDLKADALEEIGERFGAATYTSYDEFLRHEMDAVILANYFHQHAPFAVKAMEAGLHVMSECAACHTLAEGVDLVRAVERCGKVYMFAENFPYSACNQEMRRLYRAGAVGKFLYGECECVHPRPAAEKLAYSGGWDHWSNWIPATYYCTHSIAPIMYITDTSPVRVNAFIVPYDRDDPTQTLNVARNDTAAVIMLKMDNGAVVKSLHGALRGHQSWTRIHGNKGLMETSRIMNSDMLRIRREPFDKEPDEPIERLYQPELPAHFDRATWTGWGTGDFFTCCQFAEAIRTGGEPFLNVYRGVRMSIVGILAYRSALEGGAPVDVPDFRSSEEREKYEDDDWSPSPELARPGQPASSILGQIEPSEEARELARSIWSRGGGE